jgi:hypothetical protein
MGMEWADDVAGELDDDGFYGSVKFGGTLGVVYIRNGVSVLLFGNVCIESGCLVYSKVIFLGHESFHYLDVLSSFSVSVLIS